MEFSYNTFLLYTSSTITQLFIIMWHFILSINILAHRILEKSYTNVCFISILYYCAPHIDVNVL
jgi:hypothetical protein